MFSGAQYQSKVNEGTVEAVGPGARDKDGGLIPMALKVGDAVLLPEYGGQVVKVRCASNFISSSSAFALRSCCKQLRAQRFCWPTISVLDSESASQ